MTYDKKLLTRLILQSKNNMVNRCLSSKIDDRQRELMARSLPKRRPIPGVKQILVVASGKGGVGKSTVAVNLATGLKHLEPDKSVALLDADVHGPSVPFLMNLRDRPQLDDSGMLLPLTNYGVRCMSSGFLADEKSPFVWRGPMVMGALERLLRGTAWGSVDYLIVDTPPGTGDAHLSLVQNVPIVGAVIVTTPQAVAVQVALRGSRMFEKLGIPLCGVVENMSRTVCPGCGGDVPLWGNNKETTHLITELGTRLLCSISFGPDLVECGDRGTPVVIAQPTSQQASSFLNLAQNVSDFLKSQSDS